MDQGFREVEVSAMPTLLRRSVRPPVVETTRPGSIPSLGSLGCGTWDFPQRGTRVHVCVRGYRCVVCVRV